ncbi:hypothetical protein [Streptomyces rubellomurinus]|uniref:Uncharacterized protein n=1 Tax=Streptomyces sp. Y1 TaxID=3238634 RepID=A0AB39TB83_9ACTN|nr:hypothetical protein [Streptomyces rubellomurinus]
MVESGPGPAGAETPAQPAEPAERDVTWVYQPVEVALGDGGWALGRITGWWQDAAGQRWCRLRIGRSGQPARWQRYDPARVLLLPARGL